jgi:hypothetical protein
MEADVTQDSYGAGFAVAGLRFRHPVVEMTK